jgi:hypothetical protein
MAVLWYVTPCSFVDTCQWSAMSFYHHVEGTISRHYASLYLSTKLNGVTSVPFLTTTINTHVNKAIFSLVYIVYLFHCLPYGRSTASSIASSLQSAI